MITNITVSFSLLKDLKPMIYRFSTSTESVMRTVLIKMSSISKKLSIFVN